MNDNLHLYICENYQSEVKTIINSDEFSDVTFSVFPAACGRPPLNAGAMITDDRLSVCFAGGCCIKDAGKKLFSEAKLKPTSPAAGHYKRDKNKQILFEIKDNCFYLLTNQAIVDRFISEGNYLVTPGWVSRWEVHITQLWGFDRMTAIQFFKESAKQLLLLDTEVDPNAARNFSDMAQFLQIPVQVFPVGLDVFRQHLKTLVNTWRLEQEKKKLLSELADSTRKMADYAMLYTLISKISAIKSEQEVIKGILELFMILCAPSHLFYLPVIQGQAGEIVKAATGVENVPDDIEKMLALKADYAWTESANGFYLRMAYLDETVGILKADNFAFAEYKNHYLNIALPITKVCGLAIDNARKFNLLEQAKEVMREAKEAANAANKAKSDFLSSMSHELRTPLNGILGYAQILKKDDTLNESQKAGIDVIERSGTHLLNLINEILDLSKIEAGKMELHQSGFMLSEFLRDVSLIITIQAEQKGLKFHSEIAPDLPHAVCGDEKRLRQVLLNLLGNAVKFTQKGRVILRVEKGIGDRVQGVEGEGGKGSEAMPHPITLHPSPLTPSPLSFSIEDTGVGIPESQLEAIFSPFTQVSIHSRPVEGTGLGLTISRKLVRLMGGNLSVKSAVGKGSIFRFEIDLPEAAELAEKKKSEGEHIIGYVPINPDKTDKFKILIIDDRWENRIVLTNMLLPLGFEVTEAHDGEEGLSEAFSFKPDLIFMDLVMPKMDGFEATRKIRSSPELKHIKIAAITASITLSAQEIISQNHFDDYVSKPVKMDAIFKVIETHLHLKWIYKKSSASAIDDQKADDNREFIVPALDKTRILYNLAKGGDVMEIRKQLDHIEQSDPKYLPFVKEIRKLAKTFQVRQIREMMKTYIGASE